ncbi:MAG: hypothetical protein DESF_01150 [Desulfovibrio sp.]
MPASSLTSRHFWVHYGLPLLFTAILVCGAVTQLFFFKANDWDFSYFSVLPWNIGNGYGWHVPFHEITSGIPFYAHHWEPFILALVPFLTVFDSPYALSVLHSLALGAWFFLLPVLVKIIFSEAGRKDYEGWALFFIVLLFFYMPFMGPWRYQTHETTLVSPAIFLAIIALHRKKVIWACFWCAIVASAQERASLAVFSVGMYAALLLHMRRLGLGLCLAACIYFWGVVKLLLPFLRGGLPYAFNDQVSGLTHMGEKALFLFKYLAYTLFLPLAGRRAMLAASCIAPMLGMALISNRKGLYSFVHQYQDISAPFMLIAAIYGAVWLLQKNIFQRIPTSMRYAGCIIIFFCSFWGSRFSHPMLLIPMNFYDHSFHERALLHQDLDVLLAFSKGKKLYVQSDVGPIVSLRVDRYTLDESNIQTPYSDSVIAISPLFAKSYTLGKYGDALQALDANSSLQCVADTGRLRVYATKENSRPWPESQAKK